jgi:hypothetical protein
MESLDPAGREVFFVNEAHSPANLLERIANASITLFPTPADHALLVKVR